MIQTGKGMVFLIESRITNLIQNKVITLSYNILMDVATIGILDENHQFGIINIPTKIFSRRNKVLLGSKPVRIKRG